ncbi:MAG: FAD-dependent oxidoreductase [Thermaerobacter sp.]|nr:FAD-dependent oxidoreductase [Thermaerobacter sp.]
MRSVVIVGASVAGVHAAKALRSGGYDGDLHLVSKESDLPYDRPPLSKGFLLGTVHAEEIALAPPSYYEEARITLRLGVRAVAISPQRVDLSDGTHLAFDRLLLATGSRLHRLKVPGDDLDGVLYLRTLADARVLRARLLAAQHVAVVGGGFIGLEVAAAARQLGKETVVLEALNAPLARLLGEETAQALCSLHRENGVSIVTRAEVMAFTGDGGVRAVVLRDGRSFPCDLAVVGVGVTPNDDLLGARGQGIPVGEHLQSAMDGVFAAGDVARFPYRGREVRIEHWDNAQAMGEHAARAMLGHAAPFAASPFFWSDQYDTTFQYFGHVDEHDAVVLRGDPASRSFIAFYLRGGAVSAAFTAGRPRDALPLRRLVEQQAQIDPEVLRSEDASLKRLSRRE